MLRDGYLGSDLQKIGSASDICYTMGHICQKLGHCIRTLAEDMNTKREADLLNLILELSDTIHMRQFLQHDAAYK